MKNPNPENQSELVLRNRLAIESALVQFSRDLLLGGGAEDVGRIISLLGKAVNASRAYVFIFREDLSHMDNVWEWVAPGVSAQIDRLQDIPMQDYGYILDALRQGDPFTVDDVEQLKSHYPNEYAHLKAQDIQSLLIAPLVGKTHGLMGFVGFDDVVSTRSWAQEQVVLLLLACDILAHDMEHKHATAALSESERRFRELLNTINLLAIIVNPDDRITYCNTCFLETTDYAMEEALNADYITTFIPAPNRDSIHAMFREGWKNKSIPAHHESAILTRLGEEREVVWDNTVLFDPDGTPTGIACIGHDVTEQRRVEEQYRRIQRLESVGRLAGGVAHDLNNMLAPIIGHAELLLDEIPEGNPWRQAMRQILTAGEHARSLAHQLLAYGRRQVLCMDELNINTLVLGMLDILNNTTPENIEIRHFLAPDISAITADASQVEQIILNLVVNAQQAMVTGGVLTIETKNVILDQEYADSHIGVTPGFFVMLAVSDTGVGMPPQTLEKIFEPFYSTSPGGEGTGLGLATVYGIVKQHGGHIWVYSEPGQGTAFKIYFKAGQGGAPETETACARENTVGGAESILVVEDNALVRSLSETALKKFGYNVLSAASPEEALTMLKRDNPAVDLLLTDVIMPGMNGRELHEQVQKDRPHIKVLNMSGHTENIIAHQGILEQDVPFIQKPFNVRALMQSIRQVLES